MQLPDKSEDAKRQPLKTVAAFASGGGGSLIFGVDDAGAIVGLDTTTYTIEQQRDRLSQLIQQHLEPVPEVEIRAQNVDGRSLLVVQVHAGSAGAYAYMPRNEPAEFYVRRNATTSRATQADLATAFTRASAGLG